MPADLKSILTLEVPVIVVIGTRMMPVKDVVNLTPGAIIELPKLADEELEILVNNKPIGMGTAVKVGENFGVRVTYVGDLRLRLAAMAAATATPIPAESARTADDDTLTESSPAGNMADAAQSQPTAAAA